MYVIVAIRGNASVILHQQDKMLESSDVMYLLGFVTDLVII